MNFYYLNLFLCYLLCVVWVFGGLTGADETNSTNAEDELVNDAPGARLQEKLPTVLIVTLFRNKGHILPYYFSFLERLNFPKDRISLWLRSDHNEDNTKEVLHAWLFKSSHLYHHVDIEYEDEPKRHTNETSPFHWPEDRHSHIIQMKESSLAFARQIWTDFVFYLDADVLLISPDVLQNMISLNRPIVAPMVVSDGLYSNFWCGMTDEFYYQRTDEYMDIYNFDKRGEYAVPMVHSAILINMNDKRADQLTFNRTILADKYSISEEQRNKIPLDDIIIFSLSANYSGIPLVVVNYELYGFILAPLDQDDNLEKDVMQLVNTKIMIINECKEGTVVVERELEDYVLYPEPSKLTLDKIYMINLVRRPERRRQMERSYKELGLQVEHVPAIDGQILTDEYLEELGVKFLSGYADPYHNRPMTLGEIGCFLSHFLVWEKMVAHGLKEVLVLEDDIRFEPFFKERALSIMYEARQIGGWDLIYFGRKRLDHDEYWVQNSELLVHAGYSYWTLGYVVTLEGAKKLLAARPLENMLPVDEYIPIMFDQHFNETWKKAFADEEKLTAWSAAPLILFPTHYTGENGYISDTEESDLVQLEENKKEKKGNKENLDGHGNTDRSSTKSPNLELCPREAQDQCSTASDGSINSNPEFLINNVNEKSTLDTASRRTEL